MPLSVVIPSAEFYDEQKNQFFETKEQKLVLEHSLVSLSKWESKWHIPFLSKDKKTDEQILDYIRCMTLTQNVDNSVYSYIPKKIIDEISDYIADPMTATTITNKKDTKVSREVVTSEIIYYWMVALNIPQDYQKWHLNRLLTLIRVCDIKNTPPKKMTRAEIAASNKTLNAQRKAAMGHGG